MDLGRPRRLAIVSVLLAGEGRATAGTGSPCLSWAGFCDEPRRSAEDDPRVVLVDPERLYA